MSLGLESLYWLRVAIGSLRLRSRRFGGKELICGWCQQLLPAAEHERAVRETKVKERTNNKAQYYY